ncbi:UNVERIFIED_ORG: CheY-like chemotaxis protein [Kosakonia oryzae]|uniref:Response regulator receiver domain-containing protein n=2 Tax=Kosakonia radicincitans TaxID=283686 RepID=A0AAX2EU10_9ENTR|nr:response regulator [Kosakonia radicincitans]MDP9567682.1 CheY-like chemotaxis protein [Kosakonia oryzae]SFE96967.1 Response regulator receiver domain-containing protein [Kosakonia radicincitans]SFR18838.1 Response regulator receiver domain-containing protein [Kosakonia radicincitans]SFT82478.1 Response regulator receiver domain-containing protein [Kosakonia radicincitans]SFX67958.1 Response regulator receiver domain-containing protein [Kosakonia radicincitans]
MMSRYILIVDDSRLSRMISRQFVTNLHNDWKIDEAGTGEEAIALAATTAPYLILLDVNMPGIGGLETASRIRKSHPQTHIVLLTANVQHSVQAAAEELGLGFLPKPLKEPQLHALLNSLETNS